MLYCIQIETNKKVKDMSYLEYKYLELEKTLEILKAIAADYIADDRVSGLNNVELIEIAIKEYKRLMESPDEKE